MNKIKFSHKYKKLAVGSLFNIEVPESIKLLETIVVNLEDLHESFIAYDTDNGIYELPKKGKYIMLIFSKSVTEYGDMLDCDIFTTIRRYTPQKYDYYRSKRGEMFEVVIEKGKD